jgi:hypothetical protein
MYNLPTRSDTVALVDHLIFEQGYVDPPELFLAVGLLETTAFKAWQLGDTTPLANLLQLIPTGDMIALLNWLELAMRHAYRQGLIPKHHGFYNAQLNRSTLHSEMQPHYAHHFIRLCTTYFQVPDHHAQFDLFHNSAVLFREQALRAALVARQVHLAYHELSQLIQQAPNHHHIPGWQQLIITATPDHQQSNLIDTYHLKEKVMTDSLECIAYTLLGATAAQYYLAQIQIPMCAESTAPPYAETAPWLQILATATEAMQTAQWQITRTIIEHYTSWKYYAPLIELHATACWQQGDQNSAWSSWFQLCWTRPTHIIKLLESPDFPDPLLTRAWQHFHLENPPLAIADFPSWLLIHIPASTPRLKIETLPDNDHGQGFLLLMQLLDQEDTPERRHQLSQTHPRLLALYLMNAP